MAIKCNLSTFMGRDKKKVQDVCKDTGLAYNTVSFLYKEQVKRVDFTTLELLCREFNCTVGEMLEVVDDDRP